MSHASMLELRFTGYLGPNGPGKSTTIKMIAGPIDPAAGDNLLNGVPLDRDPLMWKQRLWYVPEEPASTRTCRRANTSS